MEQQNFCRDCQYFLQHYIFAASKCVWVNCGHCIFGRVKHRASLARCCGNFEPKEIEEELVTKEYLSKKLLEYVLSLDLPPKIEGGPPDKGQPAKRRKKLD